MYHRPADIVRAEAERADDFFLNERVLIATASEMRNIELPL
jgi:hypothetical protein